MSETGLDPQLRSLYRQTDPGSRFNEDLCGSSGRFGWIIDGATGVSGRQITPAPSDAAWLSRIIDESLTAASDNAPSIESLLESAESAVLHRFDALENSFPDELGPAACLGCIGVSAAGSQLVLQGAFLGDVVALVPSDDRILRWTDERSKPFEKRTLSRLESAAPSATGSLPEAVRLQILENRQQLNRPGGYWVVQPERSWAGQELRFQVTVEAGQAVVLATDGFMRLVDVFGRYTDASLHAALAQGRGLDLIAELRDLERREGVAAGRPRVKKHDDATVMVLIVDDH